MWNKNKPKPSSESSLSNLKSWLPTVHPQVGAAIYRGEAVELEQRLPHLGREPHQARQNVHHLALRETPEMEVTEIIEAKPIVFFPTQSKKKTLSRTLGKKTIPQGMVKKSIENL